LDKRGLEYKKRTTPESNDELTHQLDPPTIINYIERTVFVQNQNRTTITPQIGHGRTLHDLHTCDTICTTIIQIA